MLAEDEWPAYVETALGLADPAGRGYRSQARLIAQRTEDVPASTDAWEIVQAARAGDRRSGWEWATETCEGWAEFGSTDPVVHAGLATIPSSTRIVVIALDRHAGDGRPGPAGFQLARRAMRLADRLGLPVLTFVDTPGAEAGPEAENAGISGRSPRPSRCSRRFGCRRCRCAWAKGEAVARLAFAATDRLLILDDAVFSVIGPEGAAAILGRDADRAPEYARLLGLTAPELAALGVVDGVLSLGSSLGGSSLRSGIVAALEGAQPGDRAARHDALTKLWIR